MYESGKQYCKDKGIKINDAKRQTIQIWGTEVDQHPTGSEKALDKRKAKHREPEGIQVGLKMYNQGNVGTGSITFI